VEGNANGLRKDAGEPQGGLSSAEQKRVRVNDRKPRFSLVKSKRNHFPQQDDQRGKRTGREGEASGTMQGIEVDTPRVS